MSGRTDLARVTLVLFSLAVVVTLSFAVASSSASFSPYNPAWDGTSELRSEARTVGTESAFVYDESAYLDGDPDRTVAIVLSPDRPFTSDERAQLRRFVRNGGTLVVAEDFGPHSNPLLRDLGASARFDGRLLRDERFYRGSPAIPVATDVANHPLVDRVDAITLNHGTAILANNTTVLVNTSEYAYVDDDRSGNLSGDETLASYPVVTTEQIGSGRVVLVGDPSTLINTMIDHTDNREFVRQLVDDEDRLLLDLSHTTDPPPFVTLAHVVRTSTLLQLLVGFLVTGAVALLVENPGDTGLADRLFDSEPGRSSEAGDSDVAVDDEAIAAYLEERHPEWEREDTRRLVETLRRDERE